MMPSPSAPGRWLSGRSIGMILVSIVLLAALPAMGVIVYSSFEARGRAEREARSELENLTRSLVALQAGVTSLAEGLLATLTHTEELKNRDLAACDRLFASLLRAHPELSNIFMTDASGRVTAAGLAAFVGEDLADRKYFRDAMAAKGLGVGEFILGRTTKRPILVFARPVQEADGTTRGIIGMSYFLEGYDRFLEELEMPPHVRVTFLDPGGRRMVSHPASDGYP
ncbi:MAG TPA: cache domain-containing protein, partial [Holophaga sp.]|nr:cache domain-containing protein [Holophaga sp.]